MNKKLDRLEKKFSIATELVDSLYEEFEEIDNAPVEITVTEENEEVFNISGLKSDFLLVRNNIMKLVNSGQRVLDTASLIDVSDLTASQLKSLAEMQTAIGGNLKLLISIYKEIAEVEKMRLKDKNIKEIPQNIINGTVNNNQIMFSGSSSELLNIIKDNQNINTKENTILIEKD
ncbi:hypothetical protein GW796_05550 [archaeon]|nr:hypothetical protein [archaeon]NCQ51349.1 hypothetical protein [archaeon]NCT58825.1 hypothetical protein [archaeon]